MWAVTLISSVVVLILCFSSKEHIVLNRGVRSLEKFEQFLKVEGVERIRQTPCLCHTGFPSLGCGGCCKCWVLRTLALHTAAKFSACLGWENEAAYLITWLYSFPVSFQALLLSPFYRWESCCHSLPSVRFWVTMTIKVLWTIRSSPSQI